MGKASKLKKMRRIASQMPAIETTTMVREIVTGDELIKSGVVEVQGSQVNVW